MGYIHVTNQINYNVHWDCLCYIYTGWNTMLIDKYLDMATLTLLA